MADDGDRELKKHKPFHDFLGVSLIVGSGDASDLGSEIRNTMLFDGVPFHAINSHVSEPHMISKSVGSKRSNSDSAYTGQDGFDRLHSVKIYRGGSGSEQPRRLSNEEIFHGSKTLQATSIPQSLPHQTHSKTDGYSAKWERSATINVPHNSQYPSYTSPYVHLVPRNIFKDVAAGSSVISHVAADEDEGSRNGIKGSGVWNSMKASLVSDKFHPNSGGHISDLSGAIVTGRKLKSGVHLSEPQAPIPGDKQTKSSSSSQQMTIFYDGHAHVFDDVHPNKAEVIMALAGSIDASLSSTLSTKSSTRIVTGEIGTGTASNTDQRGKPSTAATSIPEFRSTDHISAFAGADQGSKGVK
ncbi:unnamed protein product [Rhodiola kirilowii]